MNTITTMRIRDARAAQRVMLRHGFRRVSVDTARHPIYCYDDLNRSATGVVASIQPRLIRRSWIRLTTFSFGNDHDRAVHEATVNALRGLSR